MKRIGSIYSKDSARVKQRNRTGKATQWGEGTEGNQL
jgi:hypothetical protein